MRLAHAVDVVRTAEAALMARLPTGALMQQAAAGLAAACAQMLGQVYGSRVVLLVGSGDNGGEVLYADARLAGRGAGGRGGRRGAGLCGPRLAVGRRRRTPGRARGTARRGGHRPSPVSRGEPSHEGLK